jgi:hypothetical protein
MLPEYERAKRLADRSGADQRTFAVKTLPCAQARIYPDGSVEIRVPFHRGFVASIKSLPVRHRIYEPERRTWIVSAPKGAEAICMASYIWPDLAIQDDRWGDRPALSASAKDAA